MIAYLAGETSLIELASDPTNDIHRVIGSDLPRRIHAQSSLYVQSVHRKLLPISDTLCTYSKSVEPDTSEMWAITPEERSVGKRRNFGVIYLISARGLAGQLYGPGYTEEQVECRILH